MITKSISNLRLLEVLDEDTHKVFHGCNQNWYTSIWQRLAGCGPTTAANLIFYLRQFFPAPGLMQNCLNKRICLMVMEEVWEYVKPTFKGVSTTKMFYEGMLSYAQTKRIELQYHFMDVPKNKTIRPRFSSVLKFLEEALTKDTPVAFLNLCNGAEKKLDRWHWVTIMSMEYTENGEQSFADILDDGEIKKINLALWYNTTSKGGGFIYFTTPSLIHTPIP